MSDPNHLQFRTIRHAKSTRHRTIEWDEKTLLSNGDALQFGKSIQLEESNSGETLVTDDESLQRVEIMREDEGLRVME